MVFPAMLGTQGRRKGAEPRWCVALMMLSFRVLDSIGPAGPAGPAGWDGDLQIQWVLTCFNTLTSMRYCNFGLCLLEIRHIEKLSRLGSCSNTERLFALATAKRLVWQCSSLIA